MKRTLLCSLIILVLSIFTLSYASAQTPNASLTVTKSGVPLTQSAPGTITWNVTVENTGDVTLTGVNVTDSRHGDLGSFGNLNPGALGWFTIVESDLPSGTYTDQAFAAGYYAPENLTVIGFSDLIECVVTLPNIESCDSVGTKKDTFVLGDNVYATGNGYSASATYDLYLVEDVTWVDGMAIPPRVPSTATTITSDSSGDVQATLLWSNPLVAGKYDIVVDVDGDGLYYAETDVLDDNDIEVTAGFFVVPELPLGTILAALSMFVALTGYVSLKRYRTK